MKMIERFLTQTKFSSVEDYKENLHFIIPDNFNFAYDVMDAWAAEEPDKLALLWTDDEDNCLRFTFGDLKEQSDRAASYFQTLGIGRGDVVMLILKRRYEFWLSMLALHKIGAVAVPATHMLTTHDIVYRNNRADVKAIICVGEEYVLTQVEGSMKDSPSLKTLISIGPEVPEGFHDWHKEWTGAPQFVRPEHVNDNDDTMLMYFTSGTSGEPKMVAHDFLLRPRAHHHGRVLAQSVGRQHPSYRSRHGLGQGRVGQVVRPVVRGSRGFRLRTPEVYRRKDNAQDRGIPHNVVLRAAYGLPLHDTRGLLQVRLVVPSLLLYRRRGAQPRVYDRFYELTGIRLMEGFGQTETTMTLGTMPWMTPKPGSMGMPNPQYNIDLVRPDGSSCEDGEKGEIVIRTDKHKPIGLFKGYYRDEELTRKAWHDGVYHTGDVAWRDEDGYYWFEGRIDDVIKSSGYRIGPFEVESALMTHPAVVECAITGVPDDIRGMVVKATVVLGKDWKGKEGPELVKELQNHVKHETAPYKYPRIIEFVDELPKTISGKIRRVEIRDKDSRKEK